MQKLLLRWKLLPAAVLALTLAVLGATITLAGLHLRQQIREQIVNRDGEILQALSHKQQTEDEKNHEMLSSFDDPAEQFDHILNIATRKGILGVRLFTPQGIFTNAFPGYIAEAELPREDLARLQKLDPVSRQFSPLSHFEPKAPLESVDMLAAVEDPLKPVPLLFVNVPLQSSDQDHPRLVGIAQFILQGDSIAREYAALDRNLIIQSASAFIVGGAILAATILLSFRGIQRANRLLAVQASRLLRANQELALAAKTSAVGAVTSHLIHGLRNPLSGLQGFVKSHVAGEASGTEADWRDAMESTQRMQALVSGVVRILEEQHEVGNYEVSLRELAGMVSARMQPVARAAGIHFHSQVQAEGMLGNREANLAILILENLVQNAFHVTREGGSVWLRIFQNENGVLCEVQDQGPGFPEELRSKLFQPCKSTREGGSGIGLAISKHLAMAITADLELAGSSPNGCTFRLSLPQKLLLAACTPAESIPE